MSLFARAIGMADAVEMPFHACGGPIDGGAFIIIFIFQFQIGYVELTKTEVRVCHRLLYIVVLDGLLLVG